MKLSRRYIRDRFLPDKAIDIIDEATARIRMQKESKPTHIDQQQRALIRKQAELEALQGSAATPAQKKAVATLQAEVEEFKQKVDAVVGDWQKQKDLSGQPAKNQTCYRRTDRRVELSPSPKETSPKLRRFVTGP